MKTLRKSIYSKEQALLRDWLILKRQEKGLSQRQLAVLLGVVHSFVGKTEKGERRLDVIEFISYCAALEADPRDFIDEYFKLLA